MARDSSMALPGELGPATDQKRNDAFSVANRRFTSIKDAEELRLEKLVFGDDLGFQEALGAQAEAEEDSSLDQLTGNGGEHHDKDDSDSQNDIEKVADADVGSKNDREDGRANSLSFST